MTTHMRVDPRIRAYGKARIDITRRAQSQADWQQRWKQSRYSFPFTWVDGWNQSIEYKVLDFAAEVGFYIDVLGLTVSAFSPSYAQFTSPNQGFYFAVSQTSEEELATPPGAIRIQFQVADIIKTISELERRGIQFQSELEPIYPGSPIHAAYFHTPNGVAIDIIGMAEDEAKHNLQDELIDEGGQMDAVIASVLAEREETIPLEKEEQNLSDPNKHQITNPERVVTGIQQPKPGLPARNSLRAAYRRRPTVNRVANWRPGRRSKPHNPEQQSGKPLNQKEPGSEHSSETPDLESRQELTYLQLDEAIDDGSD